MTSDSSSGFFSSPTRGITHFFTDTQNTTERVEEKNKRTNTELDQLQEQERGSLWHCAFCELTWACTRTKFWHLALVNPASVGQQVLAVVFLTSVDSLLCPAFIFSLPPSADCVLLWTAISSRLFCPPLSTDSLCLPCDLLSFLRFRSRGRSRPQALCVGFVPNQTKRFSDRHTHTHTNSTNDHHSITLDIIFYAVKN